MKRFGSQMGNNGKCCLFLKGRVASGRRILG